MGPSGLKKASSLQLFDVKRLLYCVSLSPAFLILCIDVSTQTTINSYVSSIGYMIELKFQPFFLPPSILLSLHNQYAHFAICGSIQWQGLSWGSKRTGDGISESENKWRCIPSWSSNRTINIKFSSLTIITSFFLHHFNIQPRPFLC